MSQLMTIAIAIALVGGLALVWVRVVQTLKEPAPATQPQALGKPGALVWDNRVFTSAAQLKAYLGPKAYRRWSVRHPTAFGAPAVSTPRTATKTPKTATRTTPKTTPTRTVTRTTKAPTTPAPVSAAARATPKQSESLFARLLTLLLVFGGLALGASALVPYRFAPAALRRLYAEPDRRPVALAAATAMVLGFGVAFYLG
jgi:carbohydrate-binding DOMON domain-containing protein